MCDKAARRACVLPVIAARFAVMVVPMFSPITRAMPGYMDSTPLVQSTIVMAIRAADDCTQNVSMVPMTRKASMVPKLLGSNCEKNSAKAALCAKSISFPVILRVPKAKNIKEAPKRKSPM